jgi:DnaJ like chaperone protein
MGLIIGSIIGFKLGGWLGMLICGWLGYAAEQKITGQPMNQGKKITQQRFFNALFLTMGKLAKTDGRVSTSEIKRTEGIMQHMQLTAEMRQQAIDLFNQGKQTGYNIDQALRQFGQSARRSLSLKQIFLEMLIDVAEADGRISQAEYDLLSRVSQLIGYPVPLLQAMLKMRSSRTTGGYQHQGQQQRQRRQRSATQNTAPFNPYQVLGVSQDDSKPVIRRAYKKLMSQHHPDKLVSKGLPPEMMKVAEEKAKQVQLAWERVKELKGW